MHRRISTVVLFIIVVLINQINTGNDSQRYQIHGNNMSL